MLVARWIEGLRSHYELRERVLKDVSTTIVTIIVREDAFTRQFHGTDRKDRRQVVIFTDKKPSVTRRTNWESEGSGARSDESEAL